MRVHINQNINSLSPRDLIPSSWGNWFRHWFPQPEGINSLGLRESIPSAWKNRSFSLRIQLMDSIPSAWKNWFPRAVGIDSRKLRELCVRRPLFQWRRTHCLSHRRLPPNNHIQSCNIHIDTNSTTDSMVVMRMMITCWWYHNDDDGGGGGRWRRWW